MKDRDELRKSLGSMKNDLDSKEKDQDSALKDRDVLKKMLDSSLKKARYFAKQSGEFT